MINISQEDYLTTIYRNLDDAGEIKPNLLAVKLEISNTSHPYFTGKMKLIDTAGRVDKFRTRYEKKK